MKKFTLLLFIAISFFACTSENSQNEQLSPNPSVAISRTELDQVIFKSLQNQGKFEWSS